MGVFDIVDHINPESEEQPEPTSTPINLKELKRWLDESIWYWRLTGGHRAIDFIYVLQVTRLYAFGEKEPEAIPDHCWAEFWTC